MINFDIKDNVSDELQKIVNGLKNQSGFYRVWGSRVRDQGQRTARGKGGRSFWRGVADSIAVEGVTDNQAIVAVNHVAGAQKQYGGRITAKKKWLTIPMAEESRGKRVSEFSMLDLFTIKGDNNILLGYDKGDIFQPLYLLRKSVDQDAEPYLPDNKELLKMGVDEASKMLNKAIFS